MKYKLGFILGREVALSVAEISAVLRKKEIKWETDFCKPSVFVVASENKIDLSIKELGGTIKTFEVITETNDILAEVKDWQLRQKEKRINFGLSFYGIKPIKSIGQELKNFYLEQGLKARNVIGKGNNLSSVIVNENKLIERGFEALVFKKNDHFIVGRTIEVQDYKSYSKRDFGRPRRDDKNGMLPPKLAQIMINLSGAEKDNLIYDPFCGSGTILQEALLAGYSQVYGSDIEQKQIDDTRENLAWLEQKFNTKNLGPNHLFVADATKVKPSFKVDAIVSEGYLGEPVRRNFKKAKNDAEDLATFYIKVLKNLKEIIKPNGVIVLAIPFFISKSEYIYLPLIDRLSGLGFKLISSLPQDLNIKLPGRGNLTYHRPDQFVGREILILKK